MTATEVVDRMTNLSRTLYHRCVITARPLWIIWQSLNDENNPLREPMLLHNEGARTINRLAQSALWETIMILARAFDTSGRGGALKSDRASFRVLAELYEIPGVEDEVAARARRWFEDGFSASENAATAIAEMEKISNTLARLDEEQPNRVRRLRDFRDEFLAHNLVLDAERERPLFQHVTTMLEEVTLLTESSELALAGANIDWDMLDDSAKTSAEELWRTIRRGAAP